MLAGLFCLVPVHADEQGTLVDTVIIPNKPAVVTGQVIESPGASAESTSPSFKDELPSNVSFTEYAVGANTVREYRSGDTLMYIEIINATGSSYVIDRTGDQDPEKVRRNSGVIVMRW